MALEERVKTRLTRFLKRYVLWWYAVTAALYFAMIPLTVWIFPATNLLLTIVVLFSGFTASIASLASVLVDAKQDEQLEDLADDRPSSYGSDDGAG